MSTPYKIITRDFPVTVVASDDYAAKFLALYLISAEISFSIDCAEKTNCKFQILVPAIDVSLARFLCVPSLVRPTRPQEQPHQEEVGIPVGLETKLKVTLNGVQDNEQNAAFIARAWQMMGMTTPSPSLH